MARKLPRSPEEIEQMREEAQTMTLAEVGRLHGGISKQRVSRVIGNVNRKRPPGGEGPRVVQSRAIKQQIADLFRRGLNDEQISSAVGLTPSTVQNYRSQAKLFRHFRHSREHCLCCLHKWVELFGYVPGAADWNPTQALKMGHGRRALRFEQFRARFNCPYFTSPQNRFGSWANFIEAGGYPRPRPGARALPWREAPLLSELEESPA